MKNESMFKKNAEWSIQCVNLLFKIRGALIIGIVMIQISICAAMSYAIDSISDLKASEDATILITLRSNIQKTDFSVDDNFIVRGKIVDLKINNKPHTIKAKPEGYSDKEIFIQPPYRSGAFYNFYFMIEDMESNKEKGELVDFKVIGYSRGKNNLKDDYNEALVDAKIKAIERAGVKIDSITKMENFEIKSDMVEAQAKGTIEPGYEIIEVGYDENGVYKILMIGKVRTGIK